MKNKKRDLRTRLFSRMIRKQKSQKSTDDVKAAADFLANIPKHRGRKSKAELKAIADAKAVVSKTQDQPVEAVEKEEDTPTPVGTDHTDNPPKEKTPLSGSKIENVLNNATAELKKEEHQDCTIPILFRKLRSLLQHTITVRTTTEITNSSLNSRQK